MTSERSSASELSVVLWLIGQRLLGVVVGLLFAVSVLEGFFRYFPVCGSQMKEPLTAESPLLHFSPNRQFIWSKGPFFALQNKVTTNNEGYVADYDYLQDSTLPLLAVIGDSFVEAQMVPYQLSISGRLQNARLATDRVYPFAVSGAALSHYLATAAWVHKKYRPTAYVVVVIMNDFDESLLSRKSATGFYYFDDTSERYPLVVRHYAPSGFSRLVAWSALARYLLTNLSLPNFRMPQRSLSLDEQRYQFVGNTSRDMYGERLPRSKRAVEHFLVRFAKAAQVDPSKILFVVDGLRPHLYSSEGMAAAKGSFAALMREYFLEQATERGYSVADMASPFLRRFQERGERAEFVEDGHWNAVGHDEAARQVIEWWNDRVPIRTPPPLN